MKYKLIISLLLISTSCFSQEYEYSAEDIIRSPVRKVLNMFSVTVTSGYNSTHYKQDLSGMYLLQSPNQQLVTVNNGPLLDGRPFDSYDHWFNRPRLAPQVVLEDTFDIPFPILSNPVFNPLLANDMKAYNADSLGLDFEGRGWGIPLNISVRYNYKKIRAGIGFNMELHKVKNLSPTRDDLGIRDYQTDFKTAFFKKFYGQLGYRFLDFWDYSFAGEIEIGKHFMSKKFDKAFVNNGLYYNFGISIEKNLSEYMRIIVKPSYEIKNFTVNIPPDGTIKNKNHSFNVNFGVSITIPEIPRSPMKSDHVQLKHVYTDPQTQKHYEVRGQPIWKVQNPKVGQNHRKLWKDKLRNRRKLNPY